MSLCIGISFEPWGWSCRLRILRGWLPVERTPWIIRRTINTKAPTLLTHRRDAEAIETRNSPRISLPQGAGRPHAATAKSVQRITLAANLRLSVYANFRLSFGRSLYRDLTRYVVVGRAVDNCLMYGIFPGEWLAAALAITLASFNRHSSPAPHKNLWNALENKESEPSRLDTRRLG